MSGLVSDVDIRAAGLKSEVWKIFPLFFFPAAETRFEGIVLLLWRSEAGKEILGFPAHTRVACHHWETVLAAIPATAFNCS